MRKAELVKVKLVSVFIAIIGVIAGCAYFVFQTKADQSSWVRAMTYSFYNPFSGSTSYHSGTDIGELSFFQFVSSDYMSRQVWIISIAIIIVFIVIAVLVYAFYFNEELIVSDEGIKGTAARGREINYTFDRISSVKKSALKGIIIKTTGQENIKYRLIKNQTDIVEAINARIAKNTTSSTTVSEDVETVSAADQIKKYKELLDSGVITQEEFDAKKKQLLGL